MSKQNQLRFFRSFADDLNKNNHQWKEQYLKAVHQMNDLNSIVKKCLDQAQLDIVQCIDVKQSLQAFITSYKQLKQQLYRQCQQTQKLKSVLYNKDEELISKQQEISQHINKITENKKIFDLQLERQKIKYRLLERKLQEIDDKYTKANQDLQTSRNKIGKIASQIATENRKRIQQIILSHKNQMKDFKRNLQTQSWTIENQLKKQIDSKNEEIKKLILNISRMMQKKNEQIDNDNNWKVLQNLMKPYTNYKHLTEQLSQSRQKNSTIRFQLQQTKEQLLAEEIKRLQAEKKQQQMKSQFEGLKNTINMLKKQKKDLGKTMKQLEESKDNLVNYYDNKWIQQFNSVKANIQKKCEEQINQVKDQFAIKNKHLQNKNMEIEAQTNELNAQKKIWAKQLEQMKSKLQKISRKYQKQQMLTKQLKSIIRQSQSLHKQQALIISQLHFQAMQKLRKNIVELFNEIQSHKKAYKQLKKASQNQLDNQLRQFEAKISKLNIQHEIEIHQLQAKNKQLQLAKQLQFKQSVDKLSQTINNYKLELETQALKLKENHHTILVNTLKRQKDANQKQLDKLFLQISQKNQQIAQIKAQNQNIELVRQQIKQLKKQNKRIKSQFQIEKQKIKVEHSQQLENLTKQMKQLNFLIQSNDILLSSKEKRITQLQYELDEVQSNQLQFREKLQKTKRLFMQQLQTIKIIADKSLVIKQNKCQQLQKILNQYNNSLITSDEKKVIKQLTEKNRKLQLELSQSIKLNNLLNHDKKFALNKLRQTQQQIGIQYGLIQRQVFIKKPKAIPLRSFLSTRQKSQQFIKKDDGDKAKLKIINKKSQQQARNLERRTNSALM